MLVGCSIPSWALFAPVGPHWLVASNRGFRCFQPWDPRLRPPALQRPAVPGRALAARAAGRAAGGRPGAAAPGGAALRAVAKGRRAEGGGRWMAVDGCGWENP